MLKIRFAKTGKKNAPSYRIVVTPSTSRPQGGRFLEVLGFYNPRTKEKKIEADKIKQWISQGAQVSDTVFNLLVKEKVLDGPKRKIKIKGKPGNGTKNQEVAENPSGNQETNATGNEKKGEGGVKAEKSE